MPTLSLGNLYRNLHILVGLGLVIKIPQANGKEDRFDAKVDGHPHFTCETCGQLFDLFIPSANELRSKAECMGFSVTQVETMLYGTCPGCKKKS